MTYWAAFALTMAFIGISFWLGYRNGRRNGHREGHGCEWMMQANYASMTDRERDMNPYE